MREIKFRGKSSMPKEELNLIGFNKDEWIYGNLINSPRPYILGKVVEANDEYFIPEFWVPVDPNTVGQFTGLRDKNGTEIYEGDVLGEQTTHPLEVFIKDGHVHIRYEDMDDIEEELLYQSEVFENGLEIIGNIYENPELKAGGAE